MLGQYDMAHVKIWVEFVILVAWVAAYQLMFYFRMVTAYPATVPALDAPEDDKVADAGADVGAGAGASAVAPVDAADVDTATAPAPASEPAAVV